MVRQAREGRDAQTVTRHGSVVLHFADDCVAADLQLEVSARIPRGHAARANLAAGDLVHLRKEQRQTKESEGAVSHSHLWASAHSVSPKLLAWRRVLSLSLTPPTVM